MRTILFRGWSVYDNTWVFGSLVQDDGNCTIISDGDPGIEYPVDPDSVGEATDFIDYHQNVIYEGDVLRAEFDDDRPTKTTRVVWDPIAAGFYLEERKKGKWKRLGSFDSLLARITTWWVIGNVFEGGWKTYHTRGRRG